MSGLQPIFEAPSGPFLWWGALCGISLVNAFAWATLWLYGSSRRRLLDDAFPEAQRRTATVLFTIGPGFYALTIVVALINAYACLSLHGALAVYYALDPLSRWVSRLTE